MKIDSESVNKSEEHQLATEKRGAERQDQISGNDDYQQKIAEAAYFNAKRRNFEPGNELIDWLQAEAKIRGFILSDN